MIISASRRTDIPAFYSEWFMHRIEAGYVDVINPFNRKQVSRISLKPEDVDCIVFWTKDAEPMIPYLSKLDKLGYKYYFQFTLTPYGREVEPGLREKKEILQTLQNLSKKIGKERVVWRYDPIFINRKYTSLWHKKAFSKMLDILAPYTDCCVISFLDLYAKTLRNTKSLQIRAMDRENIEKLIESFSSTAKIHNIPIQTCAEPIDLDRFGIIHGACIDTQHVGQAMGQRVAIKKDTTQREFCGCMKSVDIGQYNTCRHLCKYCYANFNQKLAIAYANDHDDNSSILTGYLRGDEKITWRKIEHVKILPTYVETESLF